MNNQRFEQARAWMDKYNITYRAIGEQLGVSLTAARKYISSDTIIPLRHAQLLELGFPAEVLPIPLDKGRGPNPKVPNFPGLAENNTRAEI